MGWEFHDRKRDERGRWASTGRTVVIKVRVTPDAHALISGMAYSNGKCISSYIQDLIKRDLIQTLYGIEDIPANG